LHARVAQPDGGLVLFNNDWAAGRDSGTGHHCAATAGAGWRRVSV